MLDDVRDRPLHEPEGDAVRPLEAHRLDGGHGEPEGERREVRGEHEVRAALEHVELAAQRTRRPTQVED